MGEVVRQARDVGELTGGAWEGERERRVGIALTMRVGREGRKGRQQEQEREGRKRRAWRRGRRENEPVPRRMISRSSDPTEEEEEVEEAIPKHYSKLEKERKGNGGGDGCRIESN